MKTVLPDIQFLNFREKFDSPVLYGNGEEGLRVVDDFIRSQNEGVVVAFDLRGLKYLGYSYAKPTIRASLRRQNVGEYGSRRIILVSDQEKSFIEGVEAALNEADMAVLVTGQVEEDILSSLRPIGEVRPHLRETFEAVKQIAPATTADVAKHINQSVQNTNNRLRNLADLGLIRRVTVTSPTGGKEWQVRVL